MDGDASLAVWPTGANLLTLWATPPNRGATWGAKIPRGYPARASLVARAQGRSSRRWGLPAPGLALAAPDSSRRPARRRASAIAPLPARTCRPAGRQGAGRGRRDGGRACRQGAGLGGRHRVVHVGGRPDGPPRDRYQNRRGGRLPADRCDGRWAGCRRGRCLDCRGGRRGGGRCGGRYLDRGSRRPVVRRGGRCLGRGPRRRGVRPWGAAGPPRGAPRAGEAGAGLESGASVRDEGRGPRGEPPDLAAPSSRRMVREMRWRGMSTDRTLTWTTSPGLATSRGSATKFFGHRGDVHEAVLVDADVDERAERGDVGHHALEDHAGLQVAQGVHALGEGRGLELGARVAAGLLQFLEYVVDRGQAERLVGELAPG